MEWPHHSRLRWSRATTTTTPSYSPAPPRHARAAGIPESPRSTHRAAATALLTPPQTGCSPPSAHSNELPAHVTPLGAWPVLVLSRRFPPAAEPAASLGEVDQSLLCRFRADRVRDHLCRGRGGLSEQAARRITASSRAGSGPEWKIRLRSLPCPASAAVQSY